MLNKKIMILAIFFVSLLAVSTVSAADNATDDVVNVENQEDNVITEENNDLTSDVDNNILSTNSKTFTDLNTLINDNEDSDVYLDSNYTFELGTDSDFTDGITIAHAVTIHGNGYTIDGAKNARIFYISNSNVVFKDIVFVNGYADDGGALYGDGSAVNCTFINNSANRGGAMYGGSAVNCTFQDNSVGGWHTYGGAMFGGSAVNCNFIGNSAEYDGGAMYGGSAVNSTFRGNHAESGGAISDASAVNCNFIGNSAGKDGGAMHRGSAVNCTFINNSANRGGAISDASAVNCTFQDNSVRGIRSYGGAMFGGSAVNCTFVGNSAENDGGAMYGGFAVDCTFIGNSATRGGAIYDVAAANCLFEYNSAEKGGAMDGSVAVDCQFNYNAASGYGGAVYNAKVSNTSQFSNNNAPNGKDTYRVTWFEKKKTTKSFTDLKNLIDESSSDIYLNDNYTFDLASDFDLINGITFKSKTVIHGNGFTIDGAYATRIFNAYCDDYDSISIVFRDIVFVNGYADDGGAIHVNYYGDCTAVNCTFIGNSASGDGGAIYVGYYGDYKAVNCTFINNSANRGGAIHCGSWSCDAVNCTFINNSANRGRAIYVDYDTECDAVNCTFINTDYGVAIYVIYVAYEGGYGNAVNCTFINNDVSDVKMVNCTFIRGTVITSNNLTTVYGVSKNLVATLKDVEGNLLAGEQIVIALNNVEYTVKTNSEGEASLAIPTNLAPGTYIATMTYEGNDEYISSTTTADVIVNKADTSISAVYNNAASEIVATLTNDVTGKAITGANVKFNINGKTTTVKTDSKGKAKFSTAELSSGTAKISYAGNSKYKSTSTSITFTKKMDTSISAVYDSANSEIVATLTNDEGKVLSSANVNVKFNGETTTIKTNTKGQVKVSTAGLPLGTYPATFSYAGNSKYNAASTSINVEIKTKVIVTDVYAYSDRIVAKLTNGATGKTIANANMIVEINGVKYNAKSDNKGQLTFNTKSLDLPNSYDLTISYRGNDRYTASSATVAVDLNKANMMITTNYHADKQKMVATLKNSITGKAVSNANMIIELNGVKTTYKSNDQGKITLPTADFAPGTYVGTVTYPGNARYNSISAAFKVDV